MTKINIAIGLVGIGILSYPGILDPRIKLAACTIAAMPGALEIIKNRRKFITVKTSIEKLIKEHNELETKIKAQKHLLTNQEQNFQDWVSQTQSEIEANRQETLLNLKKSVEAYTQYEKKGQELIEQAKLQAEAKAKAILESQLQEIENLKQSLYKEYRDKNHEVSMKEYKLNNDRKQFYEIQQNSILDFRQKYQEMDKEFAKKLAEEREDLANKKNLMLREVNNYKSKALADLEAEKIKVQSEVDIAYAELEAEQKAWELKKNRELEEIEELQEIAANQRDLELKEHKEHLAVLKQRILDQTQAQIDADIEEQIAEVERQYEAKIGKLTTKVQELTARLQASYESLQSMKKPILPKGCDHLSMLAARVITFFYNRGLFVNFVNVFEASKAVHVIVEPCDYAYKGDFDKKMFNKHLEAMQLDLLLEAPPQVNISTGQGYDIELLPRAWQFMGAVSPGMAHEPIIRNMVYGGLEERDYQVPQSIEDLNLQKMLGFIEPASAAPKSGPITQIEIDWIRYLYEWRQKATNGKSLCIKNQNDLLERVWKVTVGWATDKEVQDDGRTIRARLHEIMDMLEYPRRRRNDNENDTEL